MATNYSNWVMTNKFTQAEQAAANSGNKIEWVRFVTSTDKLQFSDLSGLTDTTLNTISIKQTTNISNIKITSSVVTVTGIITSIGNPEDYYINTILLVGKYNGQEFLAGATIAQGQAMRMPQQDENEYTEFTIRPQITVSNTDNVSVTVNPIAAATNESVDDKIRPIQQQVTDIKAVNEAQNSSISEKVSKNGNETIQGIKTFEQVIVGSVTGTANPEKASQTEAETGTDDSKMMTALKTKQSIQKNTPKASQSEAENGTDDSKFMTALKTSYAIKTSLKEIPISDLSDFKTVKYHNVGRYKPSRTITTTNLLQDILGQNVSYKITTEYYESLLYIDVIESKQTNVTNGHTYNGSIKFVFSLDSKRLLELFVYFSGTESTNVFYLTHIETKGNITLTSDFLNNGTILTKVTGNFLCLTTISVIQASQSLYLINLLPNPNFNNGASYQVAYGYSSGINKVASRRATTGGSSFANWALLS